jgi:hypothetical protein
VTTHHESKPGFLTTEFLLAVVALLLVALDAITWEQALVIVGPYALSRGIAKHGIPQTFTELEPIDLEDAHAEEAGDKLGASGLEPDPDHVPPAPATGAPPPGPLGTRGGRPTALEDV